MPALLSKQFLELVSRRNLSRVQFGFRDERSSGHVEIFAKIRDVLFGYWVRAPIPALMRDLRIVAHAVQADFQI